MERWNIDNNVGVSMDGVILVVVVWGDVCMWVGVWWWIWVFCWVYESDFGWVWL